MRDIVPSKQMTSDFPVGYIGYVEQYIQYIQHIFIKTGRTAQIPVRPIFVYNSLEDILPYIG